MDWHRDESLKSAHLYPIYAYLRSQESDDEHGFAAIDATGILLHPSIDRDFDEAVTIQGHRVRFVTVDLSQRPAAIRNRLREIVGTPSKPDR